MSGIAVGGWIFALLLALLVVRVPIGIAMFTMGSAGYVYLTGGDLAPWLNSLKNLAYARLSNYDLVVIPLFLLMGQFATHGGLSRALFRCVNAFMGHYKGGVAMAAVGACAGFGAICGSSLATAATMGQVTLPELRRFGYAGSLSTGALAAGGTLGIMIPPSVPLVIYAILTQESIGKLFMAAVLPGIIAMLGYMLVIKIIVSWKPHMGPAGARVPWGERLSALFNVLPVLLVFVVESAVFTAALGGSFGKIVTGLRVVRVDGGGHLDLLRALARAVLVALVIPPLVFRPDRRGLHDVAVGSATVTVQTARSPQT